MHYVVSLRNKRFRAGVRKQRITASKRGTVAGEKNTFPSFPSPTPYFLILALVPHFCAGKTPKSFFAPQIHGSACYAGYQKKKKNSFKKPSR